MAVKSCSVQQSSDLVTKLRSLVEVPDFARLFGVVSLVTEAADELERLRAIVGKLPKTADGVAIYPGMTVWLNSRVDVRAWIDPHGIVLQFPSGTRPLDYGPDADSEERIYSTREAAEAAMKGDNR